MQHIEDIRLLIQTLLKSTQFHALVLQSPPGWGKSTAVESVLNVEGISYRSLGSYSTPLFLYNSICESPSSLIVIDDCAGLFHDPIAISVLKAATWKSSGSGEERRVTWGTTSEKVEMESTVFSGKFILLTNGQMGGRETIAFLSRTLHLSIDFPPAERAQLLLQAAYHKDLYPDEIMAIQVANFLSDILLSENAPNISLRTLKLGYELAKSQPEGWMRLLRLLVQKSANPPAKPQAALFDDKVKVEEQFKVFHQATGMSRRTFFNYRKRVAEGRALPIGAKVQAALPLQTHFTHPKAVSPNR